MVAGHEAAGLQRGADGARLVVELAPRHERRLPVGGDRGADEPDAGRRVGRQLESLDRRRRSCHMHSDASPAPEPAARSIRVFRAGLAYATLGCDATLGGIASGLRRVVLVGWRSAMSTDAPATDVRSERRRRRARPPLHGRPRPGDRAAVAGALGRRGHVRGAEPGRPAGRPGGRRRARPQAVRARHVPVPVGHRPARRPPAGLHRHRRLQPLPADGRAQRPVLDGLRRLRPAGRAVRRADRHPPGRSRRPRTSTTYRAPDPPPRPEPRPPPLDRHHRPGLLPLDAVDLPADLRVLVRPRARRTAPAAWAAPARSASCAPSSTPAPASSTTAARGRSCRPTEQADVIDGHRLAYVSEAPVNWCPGLGTVVANEEVTADGRSDRGNFPVFKRNMRQWMMRITAYADRLIDDLDVLEWTDSLKTMQRNWIGRSHRRAHRLPIARRPDHRVHDPPRHAVRRDVHGPRARAPAGRRR